MAQFGHLVSGAAWSVAGRVLQFFLSLVALAVVARLVGPQVFGVYALAWLVIGLFDMVVNAAPMDTLVQRKRARPGHFDATFWSSLAIACTCWLSIALGAETLSGWLGGGELLATILCVRAGVLPLLACAAAPMARLARAARFKTIALVETQASIASSLVGIGLAWADAGVWSLVAMELVRAAGVAAGLWIMARWRPGLRMRRRDFTDLVAFNTSTWAAWGMGYLDGQLPRLLIGAALGPQAVGCYALGHRLYEQLSGMLMSPAYQVVQAGVARVQRDAAKARELAEGALRMSAVIACPLYLLLAALAPVLVPAVFGAAWDDAVPVVQILMLTGIRAASSTLQSAVVRSMGKPHWDLVAAFATASFTGVGVYLAAPHGLVPATLAVLLSGLLVWPLDAWFVRRLTGLGLRRQAGAGRGALWAAIAMAAAVQAIAPAVQEQVPAWLAAAVLAAAGLLVYGAALRLTMPETAQAIVRLGKALARRDRQAVRAWLRPVPD